MELSELIPTFFTSLPLWRLGQVKSQWFTTFSETFSGIYLKLAYFPSFAHYEPQELGECGARLAPFPYEKICKKKLKSCKKILNKSWKILGETHWSSLSISHFHKIVSFWPEITLLKINSFVKTLHFIILTHLTSTNF